MQHRLSSEPAMSSDSPGYPGTSRNQKIHHLVQNSQPLVPILSQVIHGHTLRYYYLKINFNIILLSAHRSS